MFYVLFLSNNFYKVNLDFHFSVFYGLNFSSFVAVTLISNATKEEVYS
jgi:hypothetical protein